MSDLNVTFIHWNTTFCGEIAVRKVNTSNNKKVFVNIKIVQSYFV